jgi:hypothetical protein
MHLSGTQYGIMKLLLMGRTHFWKKWTNFSVLTPKAVNEFPEEGLQLVLPVFPLLNLSS